MYYSDTISGTIADCQRLVEQHAARIAEQEGQGIEVIAAMPTVWDTDTVLVFAWWPRSGGEYVIWTLGAEGFYSGRYFRCSEADAWERFYRRLLTV